MLNELALTNFRQHENLVLNFTSGLNVLRAPNESGKSGIYEAIGYAFWGSRALSEPFDSVVTWGKSPYSLKVRQKFTVAGVIYTINRSKSGAELKGSDGVVVSGQQEVTNFVEKLLGATATIGMATLIARQSKMADVLEGSALSLIEELSDMGLIDDIIVRVQKDLPSGNTKALEAQIASLQNTVEPIANFSPQLGEISRCEEALSLNARAVTAKSEQIASKSEEVDLARKRLAEQASRDISRNQIGTRLARATAAIASAPVKPVFEKTVSELRASKELADRDEQIRAAWASFQVLKVTDRTRANFLVDYKTLRDEAVQSADKLTQVNQNIAVIRSETTTDETTCGFCGKNLTDVPEFVAKREKRQKDYQTLVTEREALIETIRLDSLALESFKAIESQDYLQNLAGSKLEGYVVLDSKTIPSTPIWVGEAVAATPDTTNYRVLIDQQQQAEVGYQRALATYDAAVALVGQLQAELHEVQADIALPLDSTTVAVFDGISRDLKALENQRYAFDRDLEAARANLLAAQRLAKSEMDAFLERKRQTDELVALLSEYNKTNALLKRLREVRPLVAKELWSMVLSAISHIFTQMRGTNSVVTRDTDGFKVNGISCKSYSGSTKDILGLAIRFVLQKTFLGNVDFTLLDEPASGCDEARETDLLAAITRAEFAQVLLVTHSDLADTFASNMILLKPCQ